MSDLRKTINTKPKSDRYMVRFYTEGRLYKAFKGECDRYGVDYSHAFTEFMRWYVGPTARSERSLATIRQTVALNEELKRLGVSALK